MLFATPLLQHAHRGLTRQPALPVWVNGGTGGMGDQVALEWR